MACDCGRRLERILAALGFVRAERGGWERTTRAGRVVLDLKPQHHVRSAALALITRMVA